jgi:signal transduction histidine kinase
VRQVRPWPGVDLVTSSVVDTGVAAALSILAVLSVTGVTHGGHAQGGVAAATGVVAMTVPVAWRSRAPVAAAAAVAVGALLNIAIFGPMVRCGAALPAVFLIAYSVGSVTSDRRRAAVGLGLCALDVVVQGLSDPVLGAPVLWYLLPLLGGFYAFGVLVRGRSAAAIRLARRSAELSEQREEIARLLVAVDRERLSGDLQEILGDRLERLSTTARAARAMPTDGNRVAALREVERQARDALRRMRQLVGAIDGPAPNGPTPGLSDIPALLAQAAPERTTLTVTGTSRPLAAGLTLAGYRIVEHLLSVLASEPTARVDVRVTYAGEAIELELTGPLPDATRLDKVVDVARERAAAHSGSVEAAVDGGTCRARARLPLVSGHA